MEVRWEIAWDIFDAINNRQGLDTQFEMDLNELDIEEAHAICKQKIHDIAVKAYQERERLNLAQSNEYVLAILCADHHVELMPQRKRNLKDVSNNLSRSEDISEANAFPLNKT